MSGPCSPCRTGFASNVTRAVITLATLAIGRGFAFGVDASTPAPSAPTADWACAGQGRSVGLPATAEPARLWVAATTVTGRSSLTATRMIATPASPRMIRDGLSRTPAIELSGEPAKLHGTPAYADPALAMVRSCVGASRP